MEGVRRRVPSIGGDSNAGVASSSNAPDDPSKTAAQEVAAAEAEQDRLQTRWMWQQLALGIGGLISALLFGFFSSPINLPEIEKWPAYVG